MSVLKFLYVLYCKKNQVKGPLKNEDDETTSLGSQKLFIFVFLAHIFWAAVPCMICCTGIMEPLTISSTTGVAFRLASASSLRVRACVRDLAPSAPSEDADARFFFLASDPPPPAAEAAAAEEDGRRSAPPPPSLAPLRASSSLLVGSASRSSACVIQSR